MGERMTRKINHIGIAVNNIQDFVALYRDVLGLEYSGEEFIEDQKVKVAFFDIGESRIELLEPTAPDSPVAKFIEKRGEGMHHIAVSSDDIEKDLKEMKEKGIKLIDEVPRNGAHGTKIAFIHPKETKVLLELTEEKH
jgi:methylmalonyl-CoA epimerase